MRTDNQSPEQVFRTAQILYGAFIAGVVAFTVVCLVLAPSGPGAPVPASPSAPGATPPQPPQDPLPMIAVGFAALTIVPSFLVRAFLRRRALGTDGTIDSSVVMTSVLFQGAMLEGAALFGTTVYFITADPIALLASALGIGVLAGTFPKRSEFIAQDELAQVVDEEPRFGSDV